MGFFPTAQFHLDTHLVALGKKLINLMRAHFKIVFASGESNADSFQLHIFLFFIVFSFAFFFFVFELAKVHYFANRRLCGS